MKLSGSERMRKAKQEASRQSRIKPLAPPEEFYVPSDDNNYLLGEDSEDGSNPGEGAELEDSESYPPI